MEFENSSYGRQGEPPTAIWEFEKFNEGALRAQGLGYLHSNVVLAPSSGYSWHKDISPFAARSQHWRTA